ncbi:MAG: GntR family transcriptional regulator [Planctomycetaceae bacterium]|jgi:GntR family transcriptional regulator|nr:GntR family transcriptional regulator [Planctomycetaceae bacterium]
MFIEIDLNSPQPLYEQVVQQVKFAVAAGAVQAGEMIPSVREMSKLLAVNPNTVVRAYRVLQEETVVSAQRGMGLVVTNDARSQCLAERKSIFQERFRRVFNDAVRSRLESAEIREIVGSLLASLGTA